MVNTVNSQFFLDMTIQGVVPPTAAAPPPPSTPPRSTQVTPLSSPAAKRQDVRPTPTRQRQGASAAPISRPGIQIIYCTFSPC